MPAPRPRFEIFVYSPRVEGVHLRFGSVARGGLRWSDRPQDYRTEILGLVKAQAVKNAVIVPVGAKGGFVVRAAEAGHRRGRGLLPHVHLGPARRHRQPRQGRHARPCRRRTSCATTATTPTSSSRPTRAPRSSPTSPTRSRCPTASGSATRSPPAAPSATTTRRWASPRKGAWESVKRHFRELGVDTQSEEFTVVGVGDMSGDVFGNGMLLSRHIRLLAAFDHRHVFVDPDPDAARELRRARADVRAAPLVVGRLRPLDDQRGRRGVAAHGEVGAGRAGDARRARASPRTSPRLSPPELIAAILRAPADLLWNGGIGTYVKASTEIARRRGRQDQRRRAGRRQRAARQGRGGGRQPRAHPARPHRVRPRRRQDQHRRDRQLGGRRLLRPRGQHQDPARPARRGGRAGPRGAQRPPRRDDRRRRRADAAPTTATRTWCSASAAGARGARWSNVHARLITELEARHELERELDVLPSAAQFAELEAAGQGLSSPELATLLAHTKLDLTAQVLASDLPDTPAFAGRLPEYFPRRAARPVPRGDRRRTRCAGRSSRRCSSTRWSTAPASPTPSGWGRSCRRARPTPCAPTRWPPWCSTCPRCGSGCATPRSRPPCRTRSSWSRAALLDRASRWLLTNRPQPLAVGSALARFGEPIRALMPRLPELLQGRERQTVLEHAEELQAGGRRRRAGPWRRRR